MEVKTKTKMKETAQVKVPAADQVANEESEKDQAADPEVGHTTVKVDIAHFIKNIESRHFLVNQPELLVKNKFNLN